MNTAGALYVISSPADAIVILDGLYKGKTPITLSNLAADTHTIQLDFPGYYDWKSSVEVPEGGTKTVSATLNPMPVSSTGWIYVSSSPGGASVTLDGNSVGQTPSSGSLKLNTIAVGDHTVTLARSGYKSQSSRDKRIVQYRFRSECGTRTRRHVSRKRIHVDLFESVRCKYLRG